MIQGVTGIRTQISQTVLGDGAAGQALANDLFLPLDGEQVTGGRMVWQGRLSDLLDQISDHFNADWSYDGRIIRFSTEITRTFMLHALATELNTSDDVTGNDAEGSNLPGMSLDSSVAIDVWGEIEGAVDSIVGRQGEAVYSPSTGTITVTGNPEVLRRVETYLNKQNQMRLRRVSIAVKVIDVALANGFEINTSATGLVARILESASGNLRLNNATGDVLSFVQNGGAATAEDEFTAALSMSELVERVTIAHSGSVVTLSDQPAPLQVGRQIAYLARVSSTSGDTGQVSLEPDTVTEGLTMVVLPRILDRNRILMRLAVSIIDAEEPFAAFGTDDLQIQLPEINTTGFLQNAFMNTGETMVLAGFERKQNSYTDEGIPGGLFTGGNRGTERSRNITVMLLSSEILPEYNMTVINH
jgi:type IVB pilus formation R64 PilN family outer membrane protein